MHKYLVLFLAVLSLVVAAPGFAAAPAKPAVSVVCVDGANCGWLEPLGERLARTLLKGAPVTRSFDVAGKNVLGPCAKGMTPVEADACMTDVLRGVAAKPGARGIVMHLWTENGEVVRGSASFVMDGKSETANFTLVPVDSALQLRRDLGTPPGNARFALRGALGKAAVERKLAEPVGRIPIEVIPGVRIFGDLVVEPAPTK